MRYWPWHVLDIDATNEVAAVRTGYATQLKSFDPDDDPERFAALRSARDHALMLARSGAALTEYDDDDSEDVDWAMWDDDGDGSIIDHRVSAYRPPDVDRDTLDAQSAARDDDAAHRAEIDAHYAALWALLNPEHDANFAPSPDDAAAMREHFTALLADPRMEELAFRGDVDDHFLYTLYNAAPRSDPILPMAADAFGWEARRGRVGQPQLLDSLLAHTDEVRARPPSLDVDVANFRLAILDPRHMHHVAWGELTRPSDPPLDTSGINPKRIIALLDLLAMYYKPLLNGLNYERVHYWQAQAAGIQQRRTRYGKIASFILFFGFLALMRLAPELDPGALSPRPMYTASLSAPLPIRAALTSVDGDLDVALMQVGNGVTAAEVRAKNPTLYAALAERWKTDKSIGSDPQRFKEGVRSFVRSLFGNNLYQARYADVARYRRVEVARLRELRSMGGDMCRDFVRGKISAPPFADREMATEVGALETKFLLTVPYSPTPPKRAKFYRIPGDLVEKAAKRAGLTPERWSDALDGKGSGSATCDARIALIESALELPLVRGDAILRAM